MFKKTIALILIFAMLIPLSSAAAADAPAERRTMEEILNEYHQKAFEAETQGDTETSSTWSRRGKTLEEETVDTLTANGYEAYNVTADNYASLESELQTDFASMGLNPECSYIIVIHGEEQSGTNSNARTGGSDIVVDDGDLSAGSSHFEYAYNGRTYHMRYATVTTADGDGLSKTSACALQEVDYLGSVFQNFFITAATSLADAVCKKIKLGTIASILLDNPDEQVYTELAPGSLVIISTTEWTLEFIQVWNSDTLMWDSPFWSEYTTSMMYGAGSMHDPVNRKPIPVVQDPIYFNSYSLYYFQTEQRKLFAMKAWDYNTRYSDAVSRIDFFPEDENGQPISGSEGKPLFSHIRSTSVPLPSSG